MQDRLSRLLKHYFGEATPFCDTKTQAWIREMYGTGSGTPAANARELRLENARRHAKWMARNQ